MVVTYKTTSTYPRVPCLFLTSTTTTTTMTNTITAAATLVPMIIMVCESGDGWVEKEILLETVAVTTDNDTVDSNDGREPECVESVDGDVLEATVAVDLGSVEK